MVERSPQRSLDAGRVDTNPYRPRRGACRSTQTAALFFSRRRRFPLISFPTSTPLDRRTAGHCAGALAGARRATHTTNEPQTYGADGPTDGPTGHEVRHPDRRRSATIETNPRRSTHPQDDGRPPAARAASSATSRDIPPHHLKSCNKCCNFLYGCSNQRRRSTVCGP